MQGDMIATWVAQLKCTPEIHLVEAEMMQTNCGVSKVTGMTVVEDMLVIYRSVELDDGTHPL